MRILHLLNDVGGRGNGIVNSAVDIACMQQRQGHDVVVSSAGGTWEALLEEWGVRHVTLDQRRQPTAVLEAARELRAMIVDRSIDIVHTHMHTGAALGWLATRRQQAALVCHAQSNFKRGASLVGLGRRVIAPSASVAAALKRHGVPGRRIRVVHNGTLGSPRLVSKPRPEPASIESPAIVTVAGMYRRKGIDILLRAFEEVSDHVPEVHLYLVGDGPDRPTFEAQAHRSRASTRIHFRGFQAEPQRYLLAADVFVLASRRDPNPLVISEARQYGCAIVAAAADGIPEACDDGRAAWLVPPEDPVALAEAMRSLLTDPVLAQRWRKAAGDGLDYYRLERVVADVDRVYEELVPPA